jgi:poly-gamma-glutamate synthesis protein (capsule biosynthesis protein)
MLYEEEEGNIVIALAGDSLITRKLSVYREERFLALVNLIRSADVSITNSEMLFPEYEGVPTWEPGPTFMASHPSNLSELRWMGFDMVACANNHALDYGEEGLLVNLKHLEAHALPHSGTGRNLTEAASVSP